MSPILVTSEDVAAVAPARGPSGWRPAPAGALRYNPDWTPARRRLFAGRTPVVDGVPTTDPLIERVIDRMWEGDRRMDDVVAMFGRVGAGPGRRLFEQALSCGIDRVADAPPELVALFAQLDRIPPSIDMSRVRHGAIIAANVTPAGKGAGMFLNTIATVQGGAVGAAVGATGRMQRDALHRARESATFWVHLPRPGGLERFGVAFQNAVRVRLMHAQVRAMLTQRWGLAWIREHGVPIPNSSIAAGIPTFGVANVLYDVHFGKRYDRRDLEDVHAFWSYIGYVMGADEDLIPRSPEEGMRILDFALSVMPPPSQYADALNAISDLLLDSLMASVRFPVFDEQLKPFVREALDGFYFFVGGDFLGSRITGTERPTPIGRLAPHFVRVLVLLSNVERILPGRAERMRRGAERGDPFWQLLVDQFDRLARDRADGRSPTYTAHDRSRSDEIGEPHRSV